MKKSPFDRRLRCVLTLLIAATSYHFLPATVHGSDKWILENDALRVTVNETTAGWDVLDRRCGRVWRQALVATGNEPAVHVKGISRLPAPAEGVEIQLDYTQENGSELALTARVQLLPGQADVRYELSGDLSAEVAKLALPAPFILEAPQGKLVIPQAAGLLFGVDELSWDKGHLGGNMSMPWFGATDLATGQGYAALFETADDAKFQALGRQHTPHAEALGPEGPAPHDPRFHADVGALGRAAKPVLGQSRTIQGVLRQRVPVAPGRRLLGND